MPPFKDLTGQRFGRLIPLRRQDKTKGERKHIAYICRCDCGNEKQVLAVSLRGGTTVSCGCYDRERRLSNVELTGRHGPSSPAA